MHASEQYATYTQFNHLAADKPRMLCGKIITNNGIRDVMNEVANALWRRHADRFTAG